MTNLGVAPLVAPLSRKDIERLGDRLVRKFYPRLWSEPGPFPILDFLEFQLPSHYPIDVSVDDRFPSNVEGATYPLNARGRGEIILSQRVYDGLFRDNFRDRFTCAHECGHGILHLAQLKTHLIEGGQTPLFRRSSIRAYRDPEWQSNVFAAALLMPTAAVQAFVQQWGAYPELLSDAFCVSFRAAELRLNYMARDGDLQS